MLPIITEHHSIQDVNVGWIVLRILRHLSPETTRGLREVVLAESHESAFGYYDKSTGRIELYLHALVGWQPWLLRRTIIFPYLTIGLALGHEIAHHVYRNETSEASEARASRDALQYVYPSLGVFKPIAFLLARGARFVMRARRRSRGLIEEESGPTRA